MPPVYRHVGTDREAVISFVNEAAWHGYHVVYVANDIALALPPYPLDLLPRVDRFDG